MLNWSISGILIWVCWWIWPFHPVHPDVATPVASPSAVWACDLIVDAGPDTNVCAPGGSIGLMGSVTGNAIYYAWTPATGLSNPLSLTPTANITGPVTYTLTAWGIDPDNANLIVNGDFEAGNTGFISEYTYVTDIPGDQMEMYPEGTYTVINNPNLVHNGFSACQDHTGGGGNMMVINGAANLQDIWCQTISVSPNAYYNVSAWVASVNPSSPAILRFSINGVPLGNIVNAPSNTCQWVPFNAFWPSGNNTTAEICILNLNTALGGNDFALDDISLTALCAMEDEVEITIYEEEAPDPVITGPAFVCEGDIATYTATFPPEPPILSYHWNVPDGASILGGQGTTEITIQWEDPQETLLCIEIETRCDENEGCFDVTVGTVPDLPLIAGPSAMCPGDMITLYTPEQDPDDLYAWDVPNGILITGGEGTNEIELEYSQPGEYEICLEVTNACGTTDNCTILTAFPSYLTLWDTLICEGTTFLINGTLYGKGVWSGTEVFTSVNGCDSIVEIEVMEADVLVFQNTASLCPGDSIWAGGMFQTDAGIYTDSLTTMSGCDSIVITEVILSSNDTTWIVETTCDTGLAGITITTIEQGLCDSTVVHEVVYTPADTILLQQFSCDAADTGRVVVSLINQYGCDSTIITLTSLLASDTTVLLGSTCDPANVGTTTASFMNVNGCDSTVITIIAFVLSDTTLITQWVCTLSDTGMTSALLTNAQGCDSLVITQRVFGGSDTTFLYPTSCFAADTGWNFTNELNIHGCDSVIAVYTAFLPSDTVYVFDASCTPSDTGTVTMVWTNTYGCDSTVITHTSLLPADLCTLEALFSVVPPGCAGDSSYMTVEILTGSAPFELHWAHSNQTGTINIGSKGLHTIPISFSGTTIWTLMSANGLVMTDTLEILVPPPLSIGLQSAFQHNGYDIRCFGEATGEAWVDILSPGTPPLLFAWSNGSDSIRAAQLTAGTYWATVTDDHGCTVTDSITLRAPQPMTYTLDARDILCAGEQNGGLALSLVQGGVAPWMASLNGQPSTTLLSFDQLPAGVYNIVITDQNGCTREETIILTEPEPWSVHLGSDTSVTYGSLLDLTAEFEGSPAGDVMVTWSDGLCPDCLQRPWQALSDQKLIISVADANGCVAGDEIIIDVFIDREVYIPNVFSPNEDQVNDHFYIQAGAGLQEIKSMTIWDRWGNLIFQHYAFPPNDPAYAWDGKKKGEPLNPGVFVYRVELIFTDGRPEIRYGDVTLIR